MQQINTLAYEIVVSSAVQSENVSSFLDVRARIIDKSILYRH